MATRYPDMPQEVDPVEDHINHFFDRVVACVEYRRQTLLAETNEKRLEKAARLTLRTEKQEELISLKADVEQKIKNNELKDMQERMLAEIELKLSELRLPLPETRLVFQGEFEQLEQLLLNVGEVLEEEWTVIPRYQDMRKVVEVGKRGKNPGELSFPSGVAIDENSDHIYVAEWDLARVSIFSESGEFLNSFTHEHMKYPWGIAIHRNNVYVSDTGVNGVFHFKIGSDIRLDAALVGKGSGDGKFNLPHQLTVSDNGEVFVADSNNHRVQILDESLHFQRSIKHDSMKYPYDVKLTNSEVFVLTDSSPCVIVFTHAGEKLRSFITRGKGMQVDDPWFFCLDAHNNLIFSDGGHNCVRIFSPDGTFIHSIEGFQGNFIGIQGVALSKQLKLVVISPHDTFKLQIFSC